MSHVGGVLVQAEASDALLAELDSRDAALWLLRPFADAVDPVETAQVLGLPWAFTLSESSDVALIKAIQRLEEPLDGPLVRRRGTIHVVDANPSDVTLPPRSLPVFLLGGQSLVQSKGFAATIRRQTMIQELQRRSVRHLVILAGPELALPEELAALWADGFHSLLTVVSDDPEANTKLDAWRAKAGVSWVGLVPSAAATFASDLFQRYTESRDDRLILRLRDASGTLHRLDITGRDDPEHPLLGRFELLTETHLLPLQPEDLHAEDIEQFFRDPRASWRPFAAGMAWQRDWDARNKLRGALHRLDRSGSEANRIFYVAAESGAGATTFVRDLAWYFAAEGYPVLMATQAPFMPSGREVEAFMLRCLTAATDAGIVKSTQLYEAPWLIVFDRLQWEGREGEIASFAREIEAAGRRACIVVVTSIQLPLAIYSERRLEHLTELTHTVTEADALSLGQHLNRYLRRLGTARRDDEWRSFFQSSMVGPHQRYAAFWIVLSFWLQRQFDMTETVQGWLYRLFRDEVTDGVLRRAIIDLAAMSTERQPLPEALLPPSIDYPTRDKLGDLQSKLGALGIVRFRHEVQSFWTLLHDQLGRFLLNGLFYDHAAREAAGLGEATHPEHLRLLALKRIASQPELARNDLREVAEAFATTIFKIDPSQGRILFAVYWREALAALDAMPRAFRTTSRIFLHHAAVSRRRIAISAEDFSISDDERIELLTRASADIEEALDIPQRPGEEPDLNLLNSLAHAYHDLAEVEARRGAAEDRLAELRTKAQEATRRAYRLNPDNSYVLETYARDLLINARADSTAAPGNAVEILGLVYGAMQRETAGPRRYALARLADAAFDILLSASGTELTAEPQTEGEAVIAGLRTLGEGVRRFEGMELKDYPRDNRLQAAERLAHPLLRDNAQAVRLRYLLACIDRPTDLGLQLELLEALEGTAGTFTPQLRLELAILLHQRDRHHEAARRFRDLRVLWSRGEHFVEVPERLKWLAKRDGQGRRQVRARIASGGGEGRHRARVGELQNEEVPFRSQEFGQERLRPGLELSGLISFGHNGPLLRPLTAG